MILAIVQARMGSTRFPGKMLALIQGETMIINVMKRVSKSRMVDKVVLATGNDDVNTLLVAEVHKRGFESFRGSEQDVLDRFYKCAKHYQADTIVRITGDCPLIDPTIIDKVIGLFQTEKSEYASNVRPPTYPDGMDVEVFSFSILKEVWENAKLKSEREHVTSFISNNMEKYKISNLVNHVDLSHLRLTVDKREDLAVVNEIVDILNMKKDIKQNYDYNMEDILKIIEDNPQITKANEKYERNEGYQKSLKEDKNEN